jgi:hypothetical protein
MFLEFIKPEYIFLQAWIKLAREQKGRSWVKYSFPGTELTPNI